MNWMINGISRLVKVVPLLAGTVAWPTAISISFQIY